MKRIFQRKPDNGLSYLHETVTPPVATVDYGKYALIFLVASFAMPLIIVIYRDLGLILLPLTPICFLLSIGFASAGLATNKSKGKALISLSCALVISGIFLLLV